MQIHENKLSASPPPLSGGFGGWPYPPVRHHPLGWRTRRMRLAAQPNRGIASASSGLLFVTDVQLAEGANITEQIGTCPNLVKEMRGLSKSTTELIEYAYQLLAADHPQTLRQLHYAIFSRREIAYSNNQAHYKRLSRATTAARRAHREWQLAGERDPQPEYAIPPDWMVDETRQPELVNSWQNMEAYVETVKKAYRRDNWQDQPQYCEVWSEKATILGAIRPVADRWGVTLRVCHGFGSTGMEAQVGTLFEELDKEITVFYLGDHDPSGHVIEQDMHRRVKNASGIDFRMVRLAIHASDIALFKLPPQAIKASDSRAASFRLRFGSNAATVELDALPAAELRKRVDKSVQSSIDRERWNRQVAVQQVELNCIADFAERIRNLPQAGH